MKKKKKKKKIKNSQPQTKFTGSYKIKECNFFKEYRCLKNVIHQIERNDW